ncbi:hypothetical protein WJX73_004842 [Symbiochloris irregularis]|uniref:N-acetylglucosaminylphosphatidylinositol deacetylase n=1 Tax=Symbiochloris irregularis TaxID=706552 RepID=A0AAW1PL63_9CHLO
MLALLVTAHPDDECMFFGPTLQSLRCQAVLVQLLCLSTGNAEGRGAERSVELVRACEALQVDRRDINILDDLKFQDGQSCVWSPDEVAAAVDRQLQQHEYDLVLTFDDYGVSGHSNHCATFAGIRQLAKAARLAHTSKPHFLMLESVSLLRKFSGPLELLIPRSACHDIAGDFVTLTASSSAAIRSAMALHRTQWLWYRRLFILFSRYTYMNTFKPMLV